MKHYTILKEQNLSDHNIISIGDKYVVNDIIRISHLNGTIKDIKKYLKDNNISFETIKNCDFDGRVKNEKLISKYYWDNLLKDLGFLKRYKFLKKNKWIKN